MFTFIIIVWLELAVLGSLALGRMVRAANRADRELVDDLIDASSRRETPSSAPKRAA